MPPPTMATRTASRDAVGIRTVPGMWNIGDENAWYLLVTLPSMVCFWPVPGHDTHTLSLCSGRCGDGAGILQYGILPNLFIWVPTILQLSYRHEATEAVASTVPCVPSSTESHTRSLTRSPLLL